MQAVKAAGRLCDHADTVSIFDLSKQTPAVREQAAFLLVHEFDEPRGWPTLELAREEVATVLREGFAFAALDGETLLGWVGGLPEYSGRVWELHPMVVRRGHRQRGLGRELAAAFENEARSRGGLTATLGTDDDSGMTSLANIDLYDDPQRHMTALQDRGRRHPFLFYRKLGYVVTGVLPDANGHGRPDIFMSKSLQTRGTLASIFIAPAAEAPMVLLSEVRAVPGRGLEGDRYFLAAGTFSNGHEPDSELTLIESEAIDAFSSEHAVLSHAGARRNLVTRGVSLNGLAGHEFMIGEVRLLAHGLCEPCEHLQQLTGHEAVLGGLLHRGGLRAQIMSEGTIRVGDAIRPLP